MVTPELDAGGGTLLLPPDPKKDSLTAVPWLNDPATQEMFLSIGLKYTHEGYTARLTDALSNPNRYCWMIYQDDGEGGRVHVGILNLVGRDSHTPLLELQVVIGPVYRSRGIATRAVKTAARFALSGSDGIVKKTIRAVVRQDNAASQGMLEQVGFTKFDSPIGLCHQPKGHDPIPISTYYLYAG